MNIVIKSFQLKDLRWFLSLGKKFLLVSPIRTLAVVLMTLVGQFAYILSFFLPLKIVILLGSDSIPNYFPARFAQLDRDFLIVCLSIATIGFFILNLMFEKITDYVSGTASVSLMKKSQKLVLFENQDVIAANAYQTFSRALAGMVFGLLTILLLAFLYPDMAWVMGGYLSLVIIILLVFTAKSEYVSSCIQHRLSVLLNNLSAVGFFLVFGFLVLDFVLFEPPGVIIAVMSILAGRQTFSRLAGSVKGFFRLYAQRQKLDVLFFHGRALETSSGIGNSSLWTHLHPDTRKQWVHALLSEYEIDETALADHKWPLVWHQSATAQSCALIATVGEEQYLIKIYDRKKSVGPQHESTLLADAPTELPAPAFMGATQVNGFPCTLFKLRSGAPDTSPQSTVIDYELLLQVYSVVPPERLVQRFLRSKQTLADRMNKNWLSQAAVAIANTEQKRAAFSIENHWNKLHSLISEVPLALFNPLISASPVWVCNDGNRHVLYWERWGLEPLGAGWPIDSLQLSNLISRHVEIIVRRPDANGVFPEQLALTALLFGFEKKLRANRLDVACRLLPRIWNTLLPFIERDTDSPLEIKHEG